MSQEIKIFKHHIFFFISYKISQNSYSVIKISNEIRKKKKIN